MALYELYFVWYGMVFHIDDSRPVYAAHLSGRSCPPPSPTACHPQDEPVFLSSREVQDRITTVDGQISMYFGITTLTTDKYACIL